MHPRPCNPADFPCSFTPALLLHLANFTTIRFMDLTNTNGQVGGRWTMGGRKMDNAGREEGALTSPLTSPDGHDVGLACAAERPDVL